MRVVAWILGGIALGLLAGAATGLLRRQPMRWERRASGLGTSYAGGYAPPTPAVDRNASQAWAHEAVNGSAPAQTGGKPRGAPGG